MSTPETIEFKIAQSVSEAFKSLYGADLAPADVQVQETRKEFEGEFTVVVFPFLRLSKRSPEQTATDIGEYLKNHLGELQSFQVVKGFLNLRMTAGFWTEVLKGMYAAEDYGCAPRNSKGLVLVEYASPNTNKPLHLGHLRNIFLGDSVSNILLAAGHQVQRVQIINDRGIHICKSMVAWQKFAEGATPQSTGTKGDHFVGEYYVRFDREYKRQVAELVDGGMDEETAREQAPIMVEARESLVKWEEKEPETYALWERMNGWVYEGFDATYARMGVEFDKLYYESDTWSVGKEVVLKGLEQGVFTKKKDGSVWADLSDRGLDQKLLLRKDGTTVYITQDLGTAILRYRDFPELTRMIYTVGNEQEYHFKVLFLILEKLGYDWAENCHHLSYGMVELPEGKMKSREGTVVDADDMMDEMVRTARTVTEELGKLDGMEVGQQAELYEIIGLAALKYFLLKVDPVKNMLFDPVESIDFNGHTGPFIQYTHARIKSVLRHFDTPPVIETAPDEMSKYERTIIADLHRFPQVIAEAAETSNPARLANYLYDLVKDFNAFYQNVSILKADTHTDKIFRTVMAATVAKVIHDGMAMLGIRVPERM